MNSIEVNLYELEIGNESHSIIEATQYVCEESERESASADSVNILMIDTSYSMHEYWASLHKSWNDHVAPILKGQTEIYVFSDEITLVKNSNELEEKDFIGGGTNLTGAIAKINERVQSIQAKSIRVFIITDGEHNSTPEQPPSEIEKLCIPPGKSIEVYLLGVGDGFPVEFSVSIRSVLHNGNANIPTLFWARYDDIDYAESNHMENVADKMIEQMESIASSVVKGLVEFKILPEGRTVPLFPARDVMYLYELLYFPFKPSELRSELQIFCKESSLNISYNDKKIYARFLLDKLFCQWNSVIIQNHRRKVEIPLEIFEMMDKINRKIHDKLLKEADISNTNCNTIKSRLAQKSIRYLDAEFAKLMNRSKNIIGLEGKYQTELELAEKILKTTVKSKYDSKILKIKGQTSEDYNEDVKVFINVYNQHKEKIMALPESDYDGCCCVTFSSMVKDLQDPSFLSLFDEDKFTFMKIFSVTGIPVYAPLKDSSQINPWTFHIERILNSPYNIISQTVLEQSADAGNYENSSESKEVYLQESNEDTKFNVVIPVFEKNVCAVLKPLVRTNIFAMVATFCILKNPQIVDHVAHIAVLGCAWMKTITDYSKDRPEFVNKRISLIESTAKLYMDKPSIVKYLNILFTEPEQALMTESSKVYEEKTIKCESLIKPLFFLFLERHEKKALDNIQKIVSLIVMEYIGRCISNLRNSAVVFSYFFAPELSTEEKIKAYFEKKVEETSSELLERFTREHGELNVACFTPEELKSKIQLFCREKLGPKVDHLFEIALNRQKVDGLRNFASAGNMCLKGVQVFAREMSLPHSIFSDENLFRYVAHGIQKPNSKDRFTTSVPSYDETLKTVTKEVCRENAKQFKRDVISKVMKLSEDRWLSEYFRIHENELVRPLTKTDILSRCRARGDQIDEAQFDKIFKFGKSSGLLRNACMVDACPFYLRPNRRFNQHCYVERKLGFPHRLHKVSYKVSSEPEPSADQVIKIMLCLQNDQSLSPPEPKRRATKLPSEQFLRQHIHKIEKLVEQYKQMK